MASGERSEATHQRSRSQQQQEPAAAGSSSSRIQQQQDPAAFFFLCCCFCGCRLSAAAAGSHPTRLCIRLCIYCTTSPIGGSGWKPSHRRRQNPPPQPAFSWTGSSSPTAETTAHGTFKQPSSPTAETTAHGTFKQPSKRSAVRVARQQQQDPPQQEPAAAGSSSFLFLVLLFLRLSPIGGSGEGSPPPHGQLFLFPFPPFYL